MIHGIGISEYLKIAEKTAYHFALGKKSLVLQIGCAWRFCKSKINAWIKEQEREAKK
jgi:hypothetical protein